MRHILLFVVVFLSFKTICVAQSLSEIANRFDYSKSSGFTELSKTSDSLTSKISFFGLGLINDLDALVMKELNKTLPLSKIQNITESVDLSLFNTILKNLRIPDSIKKKYILRDFSSRTYVGVFILVSDISIKSRLISLGAKLSQEQGKIISAYIPVEEIRSVLSLPQVAFIETAIPVKQNLEEARKTTNVNQVNSGFQLPKGYTGKNVLIGIIDGGFDYGHPAFYDSLGNYRVHSVWNQNDNTGTSPQSFQYGSERKSKNEIISLQSDDKNESHGTHVSGITSGANWSTTQKYKGVAYNSKLVMVSNTGGSTELFDALMYTYEKSLDLGIPSVVNMSLGSHIGPHDGSSLFDQSCDLLLQNGENKLLTLVGAAGNEGNENLHISKKFNSADTSVFSFIRFSGNSCDNPCYGVNGQGLIDIWGEKNKSISVRVGIYNKRYKQFQYITPILSSVQNWQYFTSILPDGTEVFKIYTRSREVINDKSHISIVINSEHLNSFDEQVVINVIGNNTEFHAWTSDESYVSFSDENFNLSDVLDGNSDFSVGEIGGTGKSIISVGAYNNANTTETIGDLASFSSQGPTVDNRMKPDITAPGNRVASSVNSFDQGYITGSYKKDVIGNYTFLGRSYAYAWMEGTSMSTPVVTGIIALWKEACPLITTNQIKTVLSNTSIKDQFTGSSVNNIWGNGKIDAYNGIKYILSQMPSKPRLSASGDTVICTGKSILLSAPAGFKKYMWTTGDTTRSISIDEEGEYFVFVQNDKGWWSSYSDTLNVYIDALEASISRYKPDNCLNSIYLKSSLKSDQSITWYKNDTLIVGANSATFIPKQSGIYKVRIENNDTKCFDISDTLKLDMSGYRNRLFNEDTIKSCSTDSLELDAGSGFKNYTWNTGAKTQKIKVGKTGTYSVQVSCGDEILNFGYMNFPQNSPSSSRSYFSIPDANQLDFKDEMSILLNLNIGSILSSRPTILNKGSDASYQIYLNWPMLTFSYPGMDRPKGVSVAVPQNTWFSISVVKTKDSLYMYYNGSIVDRAPAKNPIPTNNSPVVIGKRSGVDYDFFVGGIDQLSFWNRALSTAEIKNYINCTNGSESSCVGFYNFDPTENDLSTYKNHGSFYNSAFGGWLGLYGTNPFTICSGSKSVADSIHIKIEPLQNGKTSFSFDTRCIGQYINFNNTSDTTKNFPLQWKWDMGDGTGYNTSSVKHSYKRTGTYPVKLVLTSTICPKFKDSVINQLAITAPPQAQRYTPINVRKNSETPVQARNVGNSFKWKPGNFVTDSLSRITIAKVIKETDFQIHITNNSGCTVIDSLLLRVFDRFSVFVPSAFSPDGNGVNDKLKPLLVGIKEVKAFSIYSRWGNMIFSTKDVSIGWDGQFKGLPLPVDTYTWVFDGIDEDGKNVKMSGKTTLIR